MNAATREKEVERHATLRSFRQRRRYLLDDVSFDEFWMVGKREHGKTGRAKGAERCNREEYEQQMLPGLTRVM